ncbi:MAG: hypothetical protein Fur002_17810 [Anaerolineales bacterium]
MRKLQILLLTLLAAFLLVQAAFSLRWQIAHDEAPLLYEALLMQSGRMPYRDFFDFQMPGAYISYFLLGLFSNFSPLRLRVLDLAILAALLTVTFLFMRQFGKIPAIAAAILFGLKYLQGGASMSLQREYLFLPFIALALWISFQRAEIQPRESFFVGVLFGMASALKPHAALGLLPLLIFQSANLRKRWKDFLVPVVSGFVVVPALIFLWLAQHSALTPFLDIASNYWRLYAQINGNMDVLPAAERLPFALTQTLKFGKLGIWLLPALAGVYITPKENKPQAYLLAGLVATYAIYPALSGQFFDYHYLPLAYFLALSAALALQPVKLSAAKFSALAFTLLLFALAFNLRPSKTFLNQMEGRPLSKPSDRANLIAKYLDENLQPGDTVQPLDWTGGALLAMLQTRAPLATPYVFDFYFYHHISDPYIQNLRADFLNQLQTRPPRFIIEVTAEDKPWVSGADAGRQFPELQVFLRENYSIQVNKDDFRIYLLTAR